jgi:hypothetical protein
MEKKISKPGAGPAKPGPAKPSTGPSKPGQPKPGIPFKK